MSSREVSVSGVLTCLFPATTVESLTLHVSRSGLLSAYSWHESGDSDNSTGANDTQSTQSQINVKLSTPQQLGFNEIGILNIAKVHLMLRNLLSSFIYCRGIYFPQTWRNADSFWQYWDNPLVFKLFTSAPVFIHLRGYPDLDFDLSIR